jgi:hypothetical protein
MLRTKIDAILRLAPRCAGSRCGCCRSWRASGRLVGRTSRAEGHIYTSEIVFQYNPSSFKHSITTHHSRTIPLFDLKIPRPQTTRHNAVYYLHSRQQRQLRLRRPDHMPLRPGLHLRQLPCTCKHYVLADDTLLVCY